MCIYAAYLCCCGALDYTNMLLITTKNRTAVIFIQQSCFERKWYIWLIVSCAYFLRIPDTVRPPYHIRYSATIMRPMKSSRTEDVDPEAMADGLRVKGRQAVFKQQLVCLLQVHTFTAGVKNHAIPPVPGIESTLAGMGQQLLHFLVVEL